MIIYYNLKSHCELSDIDGELRTEEKIRQCEISFCRGRIDWTGDTGTCENCGCHYLTEKEK